MTFDQQILRGSFQRDPISHSPDLHASTTMTNIACDQIFPGNIHDTGDETSLTRRTIDILPSYALTTTHPPAWHPQAWHATRRQASSYGGETLKGEIPLRKNLSGWLLFVGMQLKLNIPKIHSTNSFIFSP